MIPVTERLKTDILVVGAGPAGSLAARYAAEKGVKVTMIEARSNIGVPVRCGELVPSIEEITDMLFALPEKSISNIVETSDGLYIFYRVKTVNEAETQRAEEEAYSKICKEKFEELYEGWRKDAKIEINEALWDAM